LKRGGFAPSQTPLASKRLRVRSYELESFREAKPLRAGGWEEKDKLKQGEGWKAKSPQQKRGIGSKAPKGGRVGRKRHLNCLISTPLEGCPQNRV